MAFRNIMIENPAHLSLKNQQLVIHTDCDHSAAIEDISALLIENRQTTITAAALSQLGQNGCAVFICDEKHMPCAVQLPYMQHSRQLSVIQSQLSIKEPLRKQLWKSIVEAKIQNQAECLALENKSGAEQIRTLADRVRSGDTDNVEATAAMIYFPLLFGSGFSRRYEDGRNSALNYGYAILRGYAARCLSVYGFLPVFGLNHSSSLNSFNLADDMMEPFRPAVDILVSRYISEEDVLLPQHKRMLFNCLNLEVLSDKQRHSVSYAMERMVQSLSRSLLREEAGLILPELLEPTQHRYE